MCLTVRVIHKILCYFSGGYYPEVKQTECEVDHSPSSSGVVKSECGGNATSTVDNGQLYLHLCKRDLEVLQLPFEESRTCCARDTFYSLTYILTYLLYLLTYILTYLLYLLTYILTYLLYLLTYLLYLLTYILTYIITYLLTLLTYLLTYLITYLHNYLNTYLLTHFLTYIFT